MRTPTTARACGLALSLLLLASPARAEERQVEVLGVAGIRPGGAASEARQRAIRDGISQAVYRVVAEELPALDAENAGSVGRRLFGKQARDYVTRFRVVEDRGTRPKQLTTLPRATHEYLVVVSATVDQRQVRERLRRAGMLAPTGDGSLRRVRLTLEALPSYAAYEAVRQALVDQLQAESALPIEFSAGRVVLEVVTRESGQRLLDRLSRAQIASLRIEPLEAGDREARAAVRSP
ncbi:MAG: hypothetical protein HKP30_08875 [Myxococcales bacterium]|nr:hypothetical protein [Myxococcales bacterium]